MSFFESHPELLRPFQEGRRDVLERLYRSHVRSVERYLYALARASAAPVLVQRNALADLLQEVFIRALSPTARASFDGTRPFGPYLRAIARNCFIDALRAHGRDPLSAADGSLPDIDAEGEDPEFSVEPAVQTVLNGYLDSLSDRLRGVYEQRFVLGNSQESACKALGLSRRQIRTEEERLRAGLRKALSRASLLHEATQTEPLKILRPSR